LAQRSRKKKRKARGPGAAAATKPKATPKPKPDGASAMTRGYSRTEAKNQAVRESLVPLAPGERPLPVTIGAIVAVALVVVQIPLYLLWDGDQRPALPGFLFFMGLMLVMAWGMWTVRYWAVLGFQALLALAILAAALSLMVASNLLAAVVCLAILVPAGWLFYKMVKALARIQMPKPGA
jgi:hypothetical protein